MTFRKVCLPTFNLALCNRTAYVKKCFLKNDVSLAICAQQMKYFAMRLYFYLRPSFLTELLGIISITGCVVVDFDSGFLTFSKSQSLLLFS